MSITEQSWMEIQMVVGFINARTGRTMNDRGEGVISTAIAVLITAFIGAAMWVAFDRIWGNAESNIEGEVGRIGSSG
ncbi:MAG: hypothetical protein HOM37_09795 [Acidimicrobiaceae bacterium]|jgi:hypothetical protein|nr:hypothetical protein [Acidimicrobiaceae bacterium]MBT5579175.1 hypothetical protein [Acidimicrobiaceae bacterium]MDG1410047.1 hypothetical protein [Acidimicrobiales bacterium]MDG2218297.1 hypothetical protein [Acidimicrobiales bacterium]